MHCQQLVMVEYSYVHMIALLWSMFPYNPLKVLLASGLGELAPKVRSHMFLLHLLSSYCFLLEMHFVLYFSEIISCATLIFIVA